MFCGYGTASHFPNCNVLPGKDRAANAAMRQAYFNRAWARIIRELEPRFGFPFAAEVAFLDDELFACNEPGHNAERPTEAFAKLAGTMGRRGWWTSPPYSRWTTATSSGTKCEDA